MQEKRSTGGHMCPRGGLQRDGGQRYAFVHPMKLRVNSPSQTAKCSGVELFFGLRGNEIDSGTFESRDKNGQGGSFHRGAPVHHAPVTGLNDQIGFWFGAAEQGDARFSFPRRQCKFR